MGASQHSLVGFHVGNDTHADTLFCQLRQKRFGYRYGCQVVNDNIRIIKIGHSLEDTVALLNALFANIGQELCPVNIDKDASAGS
jgi:hypothetical protein